MISRAAEVLPEASLEAEEKHRRVFALPGGEVLVREAGQEDAERLRRMFSRTSQETIYSRFHLPLPTVPEWAIGLLANGGEAIVAVGGDGEVAGHAMYVRDERDGRVSRSLPVARWRITTVCTASSVTSSRIAAYRTQVGRVRSASRWGR